MPYNQTRTSLVALVCTNPRFDLRGTVRQGTLDVICIKINFVPCKILYLAPLMFMILDRPHLM